MLEVELVGVPAELDALNRRVLQLEIEREALKRETDDASRERLGRIEFS